MRREKGVEGEELKAPPAAGSASFRTLRPAQARFRTHRPRSAGALILALLLLPAGLPAQQQPTSLSESRKRLEEIRAERERLEQQQQRLEGQVRDEGAELRNIERQRESTNRIVNELESQMQHLGGQVDQVSVELVLAEDNLADKRAVLERRLAEIYKRGRLYTFQALLSAGSFGDLVSRYKYLALQSQQDKQLVTDVEGLRRRVSRQRNDLLGLRTTLDQSREEREVELARYDRLAQQRQSRLANLRRSSRTAERQLSALERDEQVMLNLIARLERERRSGVASPRGSITTADLGRLEWPVDGRVVYDFGRESLESGAEIRWNGIGIGADAGTPVKAVEGGRVELASRLSTYGLTILLTHGDGYYSFYAQLGSLGVKQGDLVAKGQALGTVGGGATAYGPHLHFEIRGPGGAALDPTAWLRRRR